METAAKAERDRAAEVEAAARAEARRPDKDKLAKFAERIRTLATMEEASTAMATDEGYEAHDKAVCALQDVAKALEAFGS